jgi:hypothetical protein
VIGVFVYANNHLFPDLRTPSWRNVSVTAHGLAVSRYYFSARPPVAVDVLPQPKRAKNEIAAKRAYCKRNGIRYVVVADNYDDQGVREQLAELAAPVATASEPARRRPAAQKRPRRKAPAR